jgi:hypothetical protein
LATFFHGKNNKLILTKNGLGPFGGNLLIHSSGHPDPTYHVANSAQFMAPNGEMSPACLLSSIFQQCNQFGAKSWENGNETELEQNKFEQQSATIEN